MNEKLTEKALGVMARFYYNEGYRGAYKDMARTSIAFTCIGVAAFAFLMIKDHLKNKKQESEEEIES